MSQAGIQNRLPAAALLNHTPQSDVPSKFPLDNPNIRTYHIFNNQNIQSYPYCTSC